MSQSKQALRTRIRSVNSTKKITKAMEMIANAKLFRQRSRMEANKEYAQRLQDTVDEIVMKNPGVDCSYLKPKSSEAKATVIFCSDLGLCGGYNQNVLKLAKAELRLEDPVMLIGTSLYRQMKEAGFNLMNKEPISSDHIHFLELKEKVEEAIYLYDIDEVGTVQLLYTEFVNTMTFRARFDQLLPCLLDEAAIREEAESHDRLNIETMFDPDPETILNELIPMMLYDVAYADWMESTTAEQGSRRMAMKTASDNADELSEELKLEYNKARQASITQEITEIVGGSNAV